MSILKGSWPIVVFVLMFLVLPLSTFAGLFEVTFIVLGLFALALAGLIVAALVTARRRPSEPNKTAELE